MGETVSTHWDGCERLHPDCATALRERATQAEAREGAMRRTANHLTSAIDALGPMMPCEAVAYWSQRMKDDLAALSLPASDHDARVRREALEQAAARIMGTSIPRGNDAGQVGYGLKLARDAVRTLAAETPEDAMTKAEARHEARVEALREEERDALRFVRDGDAAETKENGT